MLVGKIRGIPLTDHSLHYVQSTTQFQRWTQEILHKPSCKQEFYSPVVVKNIILYYNTNKAKQNLVSVLCTNGTHSQPECSRHVIGSLIKLMEMQHKMLATHRVSASVKSSF